jgi:hypothetical protein
MSLPDRSMSHSCSKVLCNRIENCVSGRITGYLTFHIGISNYEAGIAQLV